MIETRLKKYIIWLLKTLVLISALKNIVYWVYPLLNTGWFAFHYPVIPQLSYVPFYIPFLLCGLCFLGSIIIYINKSLRVFGFVLILSGLTNLYFQLSDYLALHHDMYLSGLAFIALGIYFIRPNKNSYGAILAITASTYLISGIYKLTPDFIDGSMTADIIGRADRYFYGDIFVYFIGGAVTLSIFAIIVEIIEPFILLLGGRKIKKLSVFMTLPFHIGILATGTGTVYNLTYPILFWFLVYYDPKNETSSQPLIDLFHEYAMKFTLLVSLIYLIFLGSMLPNLIIGLVRKLL